MGDLKLVCNSCGMSCLAEKADIRQIFNGKGIQKRITCGPCRNLIKERIAKAKPGRPPKPKDYVDDSVFEDRQFVNDYVGKRRYSE